MIMEQIVKTVAFKCDVYFVEMCTETSSCSPEALNDDIASGDPVSISCSVSVRSNSIKPPYVQLAWLNSGLSLESIGSNVTASSTLVLPYSRNAKPGDTLGFQCSLSLSVNLDPSLYDQSSPSAEICSYPNRAVFCELLHMFLLSYMGFILICQYSSYCY